MSWVATAIAVSVGASAYQAKRSRKAAKRGKLEALEDAAQAKRSEVFAETEGAGIGQMGKIALELDDEIDPNITASKAGKSRVRV